MRAVVTVELSSTTTLTGCAHNGAILVCSQPVTIVPAFVSMGEGFTCTVINLSAGPVTFAGPLVSSNGSSTLPIGLAARMCALTYSGGNVVFVDMQGGVSTLGAPGQVTGLTAGVINGSSVVLSWRTPTSGDSVASYAVNYRQSSVGGAWTTLSAAGNSATVSGLLANTMYDFQVTAVNATGAGPASSIMNATPC